MTRAHAAVQLLRHGALSLRDFIHITGWGDKACHNCLQHLRLSGRVEYHGTRQRGYYSVLS